MKKNFLKIPFLLLLFLLSCKKENLLNAQKAGAFREASNPEKAAPNTRILPAEKGQTRVKGIKTKTPYSVEVLLENLGRPWGITQLPDGRLLITEKSGFLWLVSKDAKKTTKITGLPRVVDKGQGGLLDVALDPEFKENRILYWSFSEAAEKGNHTAVAKGRLSADEKKIEDAAVIFRAYPSYEGSLHYGSRLAFDKKGFLLVTTGERSDLKTRPLAQDAKTYLGKIIRITPNGNPAPGNPQAKGWRPEIYSSGHRNVQGLAVHPVNGEIWAAEMGPKGGDEVNLILPGKNYGWPVITYGEEYSGTRIGQGLGSKKGFEQPVYYWDPSVSMSGIDFYSGNLPEWKGNLFLACLGGQKLIRLVLEGHKVTGEEWLLEDRNERFRDVLSASDGSLYAITDSGKLYRISKR